MNSDQGNHPQGEEGDLPRFLESKPLTAKKPVTAQQKKQWVILVVLSLFLIVLTIQTFAGGKKKHPRSAVKSPVLAVETVAETALTPENDMFQAPGRADEEGRLSPFMRAAAAKEALVQAAAPLVLQGILSESSGSTYAVINEKIVKKGERVADKVVVTIQSDSVTLRGDSGEEEMLRMKT